MMDKRAQPNNLKEIIQNLYDNYNSIEAIYLFGSRARKTKSYRSDIDLLIYTKSGLPASDITHWIHKKYPAIDLFETNDQVNARSLINGSSIFAKDGTVFDKLDALQLWTKENGFLKDFEDWIQLTLKEANFVMSLLPDRVEINTLASSFNRELSELGLPNTQIGIDWQTIANGIAQKIEIALDTHNSKKFNKEKRAKSLNYINLSIKSEYDFQNLIHLVLKPWFVSLEAEPFTIKFDGRDVNADFSIQNNNLILEAKHIKYGEEASVLKTVKGLTDQYKQHPNVECVLFLILFNKDVMLDIAKCNEEYTDTIDKPIVVSRFLVNSLEPLS